MEMMEVLQEGASPKVQKRDGKDVDFKSMEMLRHIVSRATTGTSRAGQIRDIMANDVARVYSSVFVELCEEDRGPEEAGMWIIFSVDVRHKVCRMKLAQIQRLAVVQLRIRVTRGISCMFEHQESDIVVVVHGDDFLSTADIEDCVGWKACSTRSSTSTNSIGHDGKKQDSNHGVERVHLSQRQ